jgi:hypothetical protein
MNRPSPTSAVVPTTTFRFDEPAVAGFGGGSGDDIPFR